MKQLIKKMKHEAEEIIAQLESLNRSATDKRYAVLTIQLNIIALRLDSDRFLDKIKDN